MYECVYWTATPHIPSFSDYKALTEEKKHAPRFKVSPHSTENEKHPKNWLLSVSNNRAQSQDHKQQREQINGHIWNRKESNTEK